MKRNLLSLLLYFSLTVLQFLACSRQNEPEFGGYEKLSFRVNKALLGTSYRDDDLKFTFSPPAGWEQMPAETIAQAKQKLEQISNPTADVTVELRQFFLDKNTGASCVLSTLSGISADATGLKKLRSYAASVAQSNTEKEVKQGFFVHQDFLVHQSMVMSEMTVSVKLVFPRTPENSFQLDYVVPKSVYQQKMEAIESSIGSIASI